VYAITTPRHLSLMLYGIQQLWIQIQRENYPIDFYVLGTEASKSCSKYSWVDMLLYFTPFNTWRRKSTGILYIANERAWEEEITEVWGFLIDKKG